MQLSKEFPHTRREQYLVALPGELLSLEETGEVIAVLERVKRFHYSRFLRCILETLPPNPTERDFVLALAGAFSLSSRARERRWRRGPLARR
jgi:hypothetical protein